MATHTPGPWIVGDASRGRVTTRSDLTIANCFESADAILIAAAPDMLAALLVCEGYLQTDADGDVPTAREHWDLVRIVIAKALGGKQ